MLPFDGDFARKKTKAAGLVRKAPNNRYRPPRGHRLPPSPGPGTQLPESPSRAPGLRPQPGRRCAPRWPAWRRRRAWAAAAAPPIWPRPRRRHLPAGRASSASRVNSATRTAPAARGLLPLPLPALKLFWTFRAGRKFVSVPWSVPRGSGDTESRRRAACRDFSARSRGWGAASPRVSSASPCYWLRTPTRMGQDKEGVGRPCPSPPLTPVVLTAPAQPPDTSETPVASVGAPLNL